METQEGDVDIREMVLRESGFRQKNVGGRRVWTRQNLTAGGLFDLDISVATDEDRDAYIASKDGDMKAALLKHRDALVWRCHLRGSSEDKSVVLVRDERGMMTMMAQFLTG